MLDPSKQAQLEQDLALTQEFLPSIWRGLYDGCIDKGFTEEQSLALVKTFIISQGSGDKKAS